MHPAQIVLPGLLALALMGCSSRPSGSFLDLVKRERAVAGVPELTIKLGKALEESRFAGDRPSSLRKAMEVLGNQMGFRIETSSSGTRYLPAAKYALVDVKAPVLPGLTITREGDLVKIRPDYRREVVIEMATSPRDGFAQLMAKATTSQERSSAEAMLSFLGDKDAKGTLAKMETMDQEARKRRIEAFAANVERVRQDNGYAKAWFVTYRLRQVSTLPADSPFWTLVDALSRARTEDVIARNQAFLAASAFLAAHGKEDTKATLATYSVVAFQDAKGGLAKTEGWQAFKGE